MNYISSNEILLEQYSQDDTEFFIEYDEYFFYTFAREEEVPEGHYYCLIVEARRSESAQRAPCIDVYMQLLNNTDLRRWQNGYVDSVKYHHVKFRFKIRSDSYNDFTAEMHFGGLPKKFKLEDLIGMTCTIKLVYNYGCPLGSIEKYIDYEIEPEWFEINTK